MAEGGSCPHCLSTYNWMPAVVCAHVLKVCRAARSMGFCLAVRWTHSTQRALGEMLPVCARWLRRVKACRMGWFALAGASCHARRRRPGPAHKVPAHCNQLHRWC